MPWTNKPKPLAWHFDGACIRCTSHSGDGQGYPKTYRNGRVLKVARQIVFRRHGQLARSVQTRHMCDNTWCINPAHLIIGTARENARDRMDRGRGRCQFQAGEQHPRCRLTTQDVLAIRASNLPQDILAWHYRVSQPHISRIKSGEHRALD